MSILPRWSRAALTRWATPSSLAASPGTAMPPPIALATSSAASASMSLTTTLAPCAAIRSAIARPIPCPAPVTTTPAPSTIPALSASPAPASMSDAAGEREAAVDHDDLTGQPRRVVGEQEGHDAADVLGHPEPLQRVRRRDLLLLALVESGGELGLHHGRSHRVDPDVRAELDGELLGDVVQHRLAGAVEADAGSRLEAPDGGDVDDRASVLAHPRLVRLLGPGQRGEAVDLED